MRTLLREIIGVFFLAVIIFVGLQAAFQTFIVVGSSMEPGVQWGQRLVINKSAYFFHHPQRGDVIVFHPVNTQGSEYIKRIIGLPGDTVEIKKGMVYVNESPLDEPYIEEAPNYIMSRQEVPEGRYFVMGDNRNNSNDSHNGWTVPRENIIGKVFLSIWPPELWGTGDNYHLPELPASP